MANERLNTVRGEGGPWPWNQNLLDNWDFGNPVNQRGVSGKITVAGYFIDRWKLTSGSVEITANGLILSGTMVQILETDPGVPVTATVLTEAGPKAAQYSANTKTFTVTGTGETLIAAKIELGPVQTLAHKEGGAWVLNRRADYLDELDKCKWYTRVFIDWPAPGSTTAIGLATVNGGQGMIFLPIPGGIRKLPALITKGSFNINFPGIKSFQGVANLAVSAGNSSEEYIFLTCSLPENAGDYRGLFGSFCPVSGAMLILDANL